MSVQSRQALRLMKFVAEMRKNNYPNAGSFARLLLREFRFVLASTAVRWRKI